MSEFVLGWAGMLHRLWTSVAAITVRDQLADLVLPPLRTLPGVRLAWGLRHADDDSILEYRWSGLPLQGDYRKVAEQIAAGDPGAAEALRAEGVTEVITARLDVDGEASGTFLVGLDETADTALVAACLDQVVDVTRDAIRRLVARRAEQQMQTRDALLAEASLQMDAVLDSSQTMHRVPRMTVPAIAEGCLVYLTEDDKPVLRSSVHVDMRRLSALLDDPAVLGHLTALAAGAISGAAARGGPLDAEMLATRSVELQVLRARGRVIGVLIFLFDRSADQIPPLAFLRDIASRAALAIDNSALYERRRREVVTMQQHLLPTRLPAVDGLDLAASYTVGDQVLEVGGDFYDVVVRPGGAVAAMIGDVCGRGVDAAALTGMARHTLGALLGEGASPQRAMSRLNGRLLLDGSWRFVTAGVALIRPAAGGFTVDWTSAGHPAPAVLRREGPAEAGRGGGVPLGILAQPKLGRSRLHLAPGDTLLIFTDGLTECRDRTGRMFEERAFWETLDRLREAPPDSLVDELSLASAAYGGTRADDIAVLAIRARGTHDGGPGR